jgi:hypothetical protein
MAHGDRADRLLAVMADHLIAAGLVKRHGRMRTDSTHVLAAVRKLNRVELVSETLRAALEGIAAADERWPASLITQGWAERYGRPARYDRLPKTKDELAAYVLEVGEDGMRLLRNVYQHDAPTRLHELRQVQMLRQVWIRSPWCCGGTRRVGHPACNDRRVVTSDQVELWGAELMGLGAPGRWPTADRPTCFHPQRETAHLLPSSIPDSPGEQMRIQDILQPRRAIREENRTPRIHPETMSALLAWALRFVETFAEDITAAFDEYLVLSERSGRSRMGRDLPPPRRLKGALTDDLRVLLSGYRERGRPLPGIRDKDGTLRVNLSHLGKVLDTARGALDAPSNRAVFAEMGLPVIEGAPLDAPVTGRLDDRPWHDATIDYTEAGFLSRHLSTACFIVISYLSGMRAGENGAELHLMQHSAGSE